MVLASTSITGPWFTDRIRFVCNVVKDDLSIQAGLVNQPRTFRRVIFEVSLFVRFMLLTLRTACSGLQRW